MTDAPLLIHTENGIATLTLNRIKQHNALDAQLVTMLDQAFKNLQADESIHLVKITANGTNFCAGGDLSWFKNKTADAADTKILAQMLKRLYEFPKPIVAVAHGATFGGGVGLLACCDIVIAETTAKFCLSEVKLGLAPATISPYLVQAIGMRQATYLTITAESIRADQAKSLGLVHVIADANELASTTHNLIAKLQLNGPEAMSISKILFRYLAPLPQDYLEKTAQLLTEVRTSHEAQEGIQAFLEKRVAQW